MKEMKQIVLRHYLSGDMGWGIDKGVSIRHQLDRDISEFPPCVVGLDLSGIRLLDVSFSREVVVETLRRYRPAYQFIIMNPENEVVVENLEAALERRGETALLHKKDGKIELIGSQLGAALSSVFSTVEQLDEATSRTILARHPDLSIQNCSNKLKELWQMGLLIREEASAKSGGKECVYRSIA